MSKAMFHLRIAHRLGVIGAIVVAASAVHGQIVLSPEYERLRQYEGIYENEGAARCRSPRLRGTTSSSRCSTARNIR